MAQSTGTIGKVAGLVGRHRGLILPVMAVGLVLVIVVPLPPWLMDVMLAGNLALAALVLLTVIYASRPVDFSVFPAVLLMATLLRLVLNVASTRLILTAGRDGGGAAAARFAAGKVIWSFSQFVTSGSLAVGLVVLAIIVVIQFVVVTKGAARISEVAARFTLDAMPGKQMAIDSDLGRGLITEDEARASRAGIAREADFYGAMDGASKFLRGDAVAAVIITFVNIIGGLYVGMVQYGWSWSESVALFTRLTIGDGLVTQIPAFLLAVSAALLVARSTARTNLGEEMLSQLAARPIVLGITAAFLAALMLTSLPKVPLLMLGVGLGGLAMILSRRRKAGGEQQPPGQAGRPAGATEDAEKLLSVDPLRVELGYSLVSMVDASAGGDLMERIGGLRRQMAVELGLLMPPVRICDNMHLAARGYSVLIRGETVAEGKLYPNRLFAVGGDAVTGKLLGRQTEEPATGRPAVWISPTQQGRAEMMNYTVVEPAAVLIGHLAEVIRARAAELLTRQQVVRLLENLKAGADSLVQEAADKLNVGRIQKVLQNLLRERVSIRDLEGILEALCDAAERTDDPQRLTEAVRAGMASMLGRRFCGEDGRLWCVCLEERLEDALTEHVMGAARDRAEVPPGMERKIARALTDGLAGLRERGKAPVVLCAPQVRPALRQLIAAVEPDAAVLGYNEVESVEVQPIASVGIQS